MTGGWGRVGHDWCDGGGGSGATGGPPASATMRIQQYTTLVRRSAREWHRNNIPRMSAALSYYAIFSLSPLLLLLVAIGKMWLGLGDVRERLHGQLSGAMGPEAAAAVGTLLEGVSEDPPTVGAALGGLAIMLLGATRLFGELKAALNAILGVRETERSFFGAWGRTRAMALGMLGVLILLILLSSGFSIAVSAGAAFFDRWWAVHPLFWTGLGVGGGLALATLGFALMFYFLPDVKFPLRDVWWGAALTAGLFEVGKWAMGWYLAHEAVTSSYGAASSVMVILLWVYYSSIIVLTGAVVTQVHSRLRLQSGPTS